MLTFDISGVQKPARLKNVAAKAALLVEAMQAAGKSVPAIALSHADYFAILESVNKGRGDNAYVALCIGGVPVKCA